MSRNEFLERVRHAVAAGRPYRVDVGPISPQAGYVGVTGELCSALAAEIQFVGGQSQVVDSWQDARDQVLHWLKHYAARSAVCWRHATLDKLEIDNLLSSNQIAKYEYDDLAALPHDEQRRRILAAEVGITSADYAVAETGSLVVCAAVGQERSTSLVPPVHLAVVEEAQIVPDLFDLFSQLADRGLTSPPSNVSLISGPSKTGDIELELTTGVHGPGKWHVVIVRDSSCPAADGE